MCVFLILYKFGFKEKEEKEDMNRICEYVFFFYFFINLVLKKKKMKI